MKTIDTFLPVFPGFYGTIFECDNEENEMEHVNNERESKGLKPLDFDAFEFDYKERDKEVAIACVCFIQGELENLFKGLKLIKFEGIHSPREYNFTNDSINVEVCLANGFEEELIEYLNTNKETFSEYLKEKFTSRSGFISFYPNTFAHWIEAAKDLGGDANTLGVILDFVCLNEEISDEDMYYSLTCEQYVHASNYDELTEA